VGRLRVEEEYEDEYEYEDENTQKWKTR